MIPPEQRSEIRRLYYAEHWRIGAIATTLGVHHDTVRLAIERFIRQGTQVRPSLWIQTLDAVHEFASSLPEFQSTTARREGGGIPTAVGRPSVTIAAQAAV